MPAAPTTIATAQPPSHSSSASPRLSCHTTNGTTQAVTKTSGAAISAIAAMHWPPNASRPNTSMLFISESRRSSLFIRCRRVAASCSLASFPSNQRKLEPCIGIVDRHERADAAEEAQRHLVVLRQPSADPLIALVARESECVFGERGADAFAACLGEHPDAEHDRLGFERVVVERGEADDAAIDDAKEDATFAAHAAEPRAHLVGRHRPIEGNRVRFFDDFRDDAGDRLGVVDVCLPIRRLDLYVRLSHRGLLDRTLPPASGSSIARCFAPVRSLGSMDVRLAPYRRSVRTGTCCRAVPATPRSDTGWSSLVLFDAAGLPPCRR